MRKVLLVVSVLLVACVQAARAETNLNAAPADEYFGPYKQSVLEIRNRLNDCDVRDTGAMLDPAMPAELDHLQLAIRDWQHKYPRDPWLPGTFAHLMREYWRAGQASSESGMAALAYMRAAYPDSPETAHTVAMIYGSNPSVATVADDYAPPVRPAPMEAPPAPPAQTEQVASALPSYAIRDGGEYGMAPPVQVASPYDAAPLEQAQEPADEAPPAEAAPRVEQPVAQDQAPDNAAAPGYDAARGYDPVHGYDAARGYDVNRGHSAGSDPSATTAEASPPNR